MAINYASPMVDVNEIDKSTYIQGIATSNACIVLRNTYKGDEMKPVLISNENELTDVFGPVRDKVYNMSGTKTSVSESYRDMLAAKGYLTHGISLYAVRTMPMSATFAGLKIEEDGTFLEFDQFDALTLKTKTYTSGDIIDPDEFADEISDSALGSDDIWMISKSRGYHGNNIRVAVIDKTTQTQILSGGLTNWKPENMPVNERDSAIYNIIISTDSPLVNDTDFLFITQTKDMGGSIWRTVEIYNVSTDESATDEQGISKFAETRINSTSQWIRIKLNGDILNQSVPNNWVSSTFTQFGGGADNLDDEIEDNIIIEGYELFRDPDEANVQIFIDSSKSETVKRKIVEICEDRMNSMAVLDVNYEHVIGNKGNEANDIVQWRKGVIIPSLNINSSYAAIYSNWLEVYDQNSGKYRWIPSSGHVAGIYAYTDDVNDPWFAPAGLERGQLSNIRRLAWNPNKAERDKLYIAGINPIVSFSGKGKVVYGQKTMLDAPSAFNRVNVRRLFMVLEESIKNSALYFIFKPNDGNTRRQFTSMIEPFLSGVKSRRGVYDYRVVCDTTNNTPERIDRNEFWGDIYVQPTKTAEFIVLNFISTKTGVDFNEILINQ